MFAYTSTSFADTNKYKPIGKIIDIGGYKLHLHCTGKGNTTVILISGSLNFSFDWKLVQDKLSDSVSVCSYDRPGLAWSDPGPMPRSTIQDVYELHELLKTAKIHTPLILVVQFHPIRFYKMKGAEKVKIFNLLTATCSV